MNNEQINVELERLLGRIANPSLDTAIRKKLLTVMREIIGEIQKKLPLKMTVSFWWIDLDGKLQGGLTRQGTVTAIRCSTYDGTLSLRLKIKEHQRPPFEGKIERYQLLRIDS